MCLANVYFINSDFGIATVDLKKIKGLIEQAGGVTGKSMALRAKYLAKAGKIMQDLLVQHSKLKTEIGPAPTHAAMVVREKVYPNVTIRIGNKKKEIKRGMGSATLELEHDELTIS